ncbi:MAG: hypothetical protein H6817_07320 [Phycisphaerales bacterium]|nr:hypothetical protein [Phycisphaerales bacterium]
MPAAERTNSVVPLVLAVAALATIVQAILFLSASLWVTPDSAGYITLAAGIAERWDFSNPLFRFRLPGYPLMLATIFRAFGTRSGVALLVVQHIMVVGCAMLTVLIAHRLRPSRRFAMFVAIPAIVGLHLAGYANVVLTEVPYTLLLLGFVYLLVRFLTGCGRWSLIGASLCAGLMALFRDSGQFLLLVCAVAAIASAFRRVRDDRRLMMTGAFALLPGILVLTPFIVQSHRAFGTWSLNCNRDMLPYYRAACVERLDAPNSEAVAKVRAALSAAQDEHIVSASATIHDYLPAVRAVQHQFDPQSQQTFASAHLDDAATLLGRAGWDIMREHPGTIALGTLRHAKFLLFTPDDAYRVLPNRSGAGVRSPNVHTEFVTRRVGPDVLAAYLSLDYSPSHSATPISKFVNGTHRWFEEPVLLLSGLGLKISLYEVFVALALLGGVVSLVRRSAGAWWMIAIVVAYHVVGAAFMGGREPRYVVPVLPLMSIWFMLAGATGVAVARRLLGRNTFDVTSDARRDQFGLGGLRVRARQHVVEPPVNR